jgi:hypothetical protein
MMGNRVALERRSQEREARQPKTRAARRRCERSVRGLRRRRLHQSNPHRMTPEAGNAPGCRKEPGGERRSVLWPEALRRGRRLPSVRHRLRGVATDALGSKRAARGLKTILATNTIDLSLWYYSSARNEDIPRADLPQGFHNHSAGPRPRVAPQRDEAVSCLACSQRQPGVKPFKRLSGVPERRYARGLDLEMAFGLPTPLWRRLAEPRRN